MHKTTATVPNRPSASPTSETKPAVTFALANLKQMVQTIIQRLDGIQGVMNLVEVREPDSCSSLSNEEVASFSEEVGPDHPTRVRH